jgi:hypothetical protein
MNILCVFFSHTSSYFFVSKRLRELMGQQCLGEDAERSVALQQTISGTYNTSSSANCANGCCVTRGQPKILGDSEATPQVPWHRHMTTTTPSSTDNSRNRSTTKNEQARNEDETPDDASLTNPSLASLLPLSPQASLERSRDIHELGLDEARNNPLLMWGTSSIASPRRSQQGAAAVQFHDSIVVFLGDMDVEEEGDDESLAAGDIEHVLSQGSSSLSSRQPLRRALSDEESRGCTDPFVSLAASRSTDSIQKQLVVNETHRAGVAQRLRGFGVDKECFRSPRRQ